MDKPDDTPILICATVAEMPVAVFEDSHKATCKFCKQELWATDAGERQALAQGFTLDQLAHCCGACFVTQIYSTGGPHTMVPPSPEVVADVLLKCLESED